MAAAGPRPRVIRPDMRGGCAPTGIATIEGEPLEIFPFLGSSRLVETIDRFKVSAVVHGHAHRGRYEGRTPAGAPVYNVAFPIAKPTGRPYALIEL